MGLFYLHRSTLNIRMMLGRLSRTILLCLAIQPAGMVLGQPPINFHRLSASDGLNDSNITDVCEDREGFMWFASQGALNRFDGARVERLTHISGDSTSAWPEIAYAVVNDAHGRLWIGYADGLREFDFKAHAFRTVDVMRGRQVFDLVADHQGRIYTQGRPGVLCYNPASDSIEVLGNPADSMAYALLNTIQPNCLYVSEPYLYAGLPQRLLRYHIETRETQIIDLPDLQSSPYQIALDSAGQYWIATTSSELVHVDSEGHLLARLDSVLSAGSTGQLSVAVGLHIDARGTLWIPTNQKGLMQYLPREQKVLREVFDGQGRRSISSNQLRSMTLDSRGIYWLTSISGVDYFDPMQSWFEIIYPDPDPLGIRFGRGICQDFDGNYWFTTSDGIVRYNPSARSYRQWRNTAGTPNVIYNNSSRGVAQGADGMFWFATAGGVNRLDPETGQIDFYDDDRGLPESFYLFTKAAAHGRVWFGSSRDDGLYYYSPVDDAVHSIADHPALTQFTGYGVRNVFEDHHGRFWIGFNGNGLAMYDPILGTIRHWTNEIQDGEQALVGSLVIDIAEDHRGIIWVSTFNGISGVDPVSGEVRSFDHTSGLTSNIAGPLAIDARDRIWVGLSNRLVMLDSMRRKFTYFDQEDGIPGPYFTEHGALTDRDGYIVMPTTDGYVRFDPMRIQSTERVLESFVTAFHVFDHQQSLQVDDDSVLSVNLGPEENFFSFTLGALNFNKAAQTWYAYQLMGFDRGWRYTQTGRAVYTNVPGGQYTFRFKASTDPEKWGDHENVVRVSVGTVFYKMIWFWLLVGIVMLALLYWYYRSRLRAQQTVLDLRNRAQLLEKEKAVVQYESLKQQLNPHFLFNSLTSLSSLILKDRNIASDFLERLSKTYRYILKSSDHEVVSLEEELTFARTYVELQKTRFASGFIVHFDVGETAGQRRIAPVTVQNLLENAIKHNIIDPETPLVVRIRIEEDDLVISNNLQRKKFVETSNQRGLENLKALYRYLSSREVRIIDDGRMFSVKIPLI